MWVRIDRQEHSALRRALGRGAIRIAAATAAAGLLSGYWTVSEMRPQDLAPLPGWYRPAAAVAAAPALEQEAFAFDHFGAVEPEEAGFRWAEMARISSITQCPDATPVFRNGCARYLTKASASASAVRVMRADGRARGRAAWDASTAAEDAYFAAPDPGVPSEDEEPTGDMIAPDALT